MMGQDELGLNERVGGLVQDIERVRRETAVAIEALEKEREDCLARIEPSAEVVAAKRLIETLLQKVVGRPSLADVPVRGTAATGDDGTAADSGGTGRGTGRGDR